MGLQKRHHQCKAETYRNLQNKLRKGVDVNAKDGGSGQPDIFVVFTIILCGLATYSFEAVRVLKSGI